MGESPLHIRRSLPADWSAIRSIFIPVVRAGETYVYAPDISEQEAQLAWMQQPQTKRQATYVAELNGELVGSYFLRPNQPGLGDHVCNCAYMVAPTARGLGVATSMCRHSQAEALAAGYQAMQFNFVVSTNTGAIQLWKKLGFNCVGRLPDAYRHARLGLVDALVMYKWLDRPDKTTLARK